MIGGWLAAEALQPPSYSPVRSTISGLACLGGTGRWIMTSALFVVGAGYFVTAAGLPGVRVPARIVLMAPAAAHRGTPRPGPPRARPALLAWWPPQRPPAARPRTPKEIGMTTTRTPPPVSPPEQAIASAGSPIRVRLPVGGWQVGFRIQPDGRTVIEVTDQDESLTGLMTSTRLPITSIDAGWSGLTRDPAGGRHCGRWPSGTCPPMPASQRSPSPAGPATAPAQRRRTPWTACGSPMTGCGSPPPPGTTRWPA